MIKVIEKASNISMKRKIFWTVFSSFLLVLIAALTIALVIMHNSYVSNEKTRLQQFTQNAAAEVNHLGLSFLAHNLINNQYRLTYIAKDGTVLFDNEGDTSTMENHFEREEIKEARLSGTGECMRFSHTMETQTYYYAVKLDNDAILRAAVTTVSLLTVTAHMAVYFAVIIVFLGMISYLFAAWLANSIVKPLNEIDLNHPLCNDAYSEVQPFLRKIEKQQLQIESQLEELVSKNEEFLVITKSMTEGLLLLNRQGIILTVNKTARKIFNVSEDCIGKSILSIDRTNTYTQEFLLLDKKTKQKIVEIQKDGRDYQIRYNQIIVNNRIAGFALIVIDVTEKRRAERQRQEFTANVSHELKTPLQSIIGCAELIENGLVKNGDLEAFAGRIRSQGSRLVRLIEDIILLSRLDELHESMHETVSFNQITKEVFESIAHKAEEHHIELIKEGPDITYYGVYRYLYELIYNLCDNAVKYGKDQGYVKVITEETEKKIIIKVKDNGIGIPIEHQARIFERFYRVDKSHSRRMGGTGLGLSIVKRVVLFHKGKIKLESKEGVGSTFIVCFKKRLAADKTQEQAAETEEQNKE